MRASVVSEFLACIDQYTTPTERFHLNKLKFYDSLVDLYKHLRSMAKKRAKKENLRQPDRIIFDATNYKWLSVGLGCIILGFTAMRIENEIRGVISLYVAPIVIVAGFAIVAYSILAKSGSDANAKPSENQ